MTRTYSLEEIEAARNYILYNDTRLALISLLPDTELIPFAFWCVRQIWDDITSYDQSRAKMAEMYVCGEITLGELLDDERLSMRMPTAVSYLVSAVAATPWRVPMITHVNITARMAGVDYLDELVRRLESAS
jgi:hypothetical protein